MSRRTPAPTRVITTRYPKLMPLARTAVRLHPRPAAVDVPASASKIGGPILWPLTDPWPTCGDLEYVVQQVELAPDDPFSIMAAQHNPGLLRRGTAYEGSGVGPADQRHTGIFLPILQIRRADVPELPFPAESDLFQMVWCSRLHMPDLQPRMRVAWRTERLLTTTRTEFPAPLSNEAHLGPHTDDLLIPLRVCLLQPERVVEYPSLRDLEERRVLSTDTLADLMDEHESGALGTAYAGTKVGGYPDWIQDPAWPQCAQGHDMVHLMTFDSSEPLDTLLLSADERAERRRAEQVGWMFAEPTGMIFGRFGSMYVFYCPACPEHPLTLETQ